MDIEVVTTVPFARPAVFVGMRDQMPALCQYMPNIESVTVESRDDGTPGETRLVNRWQAAKSEVPVVARKFVDPKRMFWLDHAHWIDGVWRCDWRLEMGFMPDRIACSGSTTYHEVEGGTELRIKGTLTLRLDGLLPGFILKKAQPAIEGFVLSTVKPNFQRTADALTEYLRHNAAE